MSSSTVKQEAARRDAPSATEAPRTWLLASPHTGDNTQLLSLADALCWPFEIKRFAYKSIEAVSRLVSRPTLIAVDREKSDAIAPPYPDLVICAGRPTEAIAMWIRRNGNTSVRLVYVGTPWARLDQFDLVITTPQYRLPVLPNVLHNALPLHHVEPQKLSAAALSWESRLVHLPRPWIAVLVGGPSGPYGFDAAAATRLARDASAVAEAAGGALLVTTSARTPSAVTDALSAAITAPSYFFRWTPVTEENPFAAYLALADRFIVTADSISMLAEASATGKPLMLFDPEEERQSMRAEEDGVAVGDRLPPPHWLGRDLSTTAFRLAMRYGPVAWSRDLRIVHRQLVDAGRASWLGDTPSSPHPVSAGQDMAQSVARIRALFDIQSHP
jgi:mitochondrial fission protein ELM1